MLMSYVCHIINAFICRVYAFLHTFYKCYITIVMSKTKWAQPINQQATSDEQVGYCAGYLEQVPVKAFKENLSLEITSQQHHQMPRNCSGTDFYEKIWKDLPIFANLFLCSSVFT